jgi:hypothetical protein
VKLSRQQLYELVWLKPITKLAREFGLSDVGLAKICRRHGIPLPERGYWARVDAGQAPAKKALTRKDNNPEIVIYEREPITDEMLAQQKLKKEKQAAALAQVGKLTVPTELNSPHKLTLQTQKFFQSIEKKLQREATITDKYKLDWQERAPSAEYGRYICSSREGFNLKVSLDKLNRALCFLDALVKALEHHGFKIQNNIDGHRGQITVEAIKDSEGVRFHLQEGYKQRFLTEKEFAFERSINSYASPMARAPSGIFTLSVAGRNDWSDKKFIDGNRKIEDCLTEIVAEFIDLVPRQKLQRIANAKAKEEAEERARIKDLERRKREEQLKQYTDALGEAERLNQLEQFEIYLQRLEKQYIAEYGEIGASVAEWFSNVRAYAQVNNPLANRLTYLHMLSNKAENKDSQ